MAHYRYEVHKMAGHLERGTTSDVSAQLVKKMREAIDTDVAEGLRRLSVTFTSKGGRLEALNLQNGPFTAQRIKYATLEARSLSMGDRN